MPNSSQDIQRKAGFFHSLGKVITKDTNDVGNELYKSSHNVRSNEVWMDSISYAPTVASASQYSDDIIVRQVGTSSNPVYLYPLAGSNYQSWFMDTGTPSAKVTGFEPSSEWVKPLINPSDVPNAAGAPSFGYEFIEPAEGRLACGTSGKGKLESPEVIVDRVLMELYQKKDLLNKNVIVTAGPTIAPLDPVRFITNRSTGKMGYAIAKEARNRGANVTLISGPTSIEVPKNINLIRVSTNEEMKNEVIKKFDDADIVIKSAAVADYKPKNYSSQKIKKGDKGLSIDFIRDNDILMELGSKKGNQILVGFAAESQNLKENAMSKLQRKNLDFIVANDITSTDTGFASEDNKVMILSKEGKEIHLDKMSKEKIASNLFDIIFEKR